MSRAELAKLMEELLDAHLDTVELTSRLTPDRDWQAHLGYLRALLRVGQEQLAALEAERVSR